jgi:transketolase
MGLSIATGIALAAKRDGRSYRCVSLLGDGECHEGSIWEAALFASQHRLGNLTAVIDHNNLSATDYLKNSVSVEPLREKWASFGWETLLVDGHDFRSLLPALSRVRSRTGDRPLAVIALTTKGKGVRFMENRPIWHYRIPVGRELTQARAQLQTPKTGRKGRHS